MTQLGVIEGFYGQPWSWGERADYAAFLGKHGFSFYIYAPKGDPYLRRKWREPFPKAHEEKMARLAGQFRSSGVEFGIGFSPYEIYLSPFDSGIKKLLQSRIDVFNRVGAAKLCVLMDDMRGDLPGLAERQAEVAAWVAARSRAKEVLFCPTYYSDDPALERLFGKMPEGYFGSLNKGLPPGVQIFWTGEQVCSPSYTPEHLAEAGRRLGRRPFLWDNYPVNDGPRMCAFLHLRPFTGRPHGMWDLLSGHAVNPMNQAALSRIPLLTLAEARRKGAGYDPQKAFRKAARAATCGGMAELLERDLPAFADRGLDALTEEEKASLRDDYSAFLETRENDTARAAREVIDWLAGRYRVTKELILSQ